MRPGPSMRRAFVSLLFRLTAQLFHPPADAAQGLVPAENMANFHSPAGGDRLAREGGAHRPHNPAVLQPVLLRQADKGVVDGVVAPLVQPL